MHDKFLYVFMQKKSPFDQIKYFNYLKCKIKLKKATFVFVSLSTFVLQV
jgi:hypothetical protein